MHADKQKHILIAVLDWGLGHATRCVPIIKLLLENQCKVSVAGNGSSLVLLKQEFPQLTFHELPSYKVSYPSDGFFLLHLFLQIPGIFRAIRQEHRVLEQLVDKYKLDAVISDNRYGCYSEKVPSVFITHQLNIPLPSSLSWSGKWVNYFNHRSIRKFSVCWVPDFKNSHLTGRLTRASDLNIRFIGSLSRFSYTDTKIKDGNIVALISGPEPQREILEGLIVNELRKLQQCSLIVRGLPQLPAGEKTEGNITIMNHASAVQLQQLISQADIIISRSGYSTVMDLFALRKKRILFIPTPGQTEQEYLAWKLESEGIAFAQSQDKLDVQEAIQKLNQYRGFDTNEPRTNLLNEAINELLQQL